MIPRLCWTVVTLFVALPLAARGEAPDAARVRQITAWLPGGPVSPAPKLEDRPFWHRVGRAAQYRHVVEQAERIGPPASLPDDLYLDYSRTGNRSRYQSVYFAKLKSLRTLVVAECVENQGRFLPAISRMIASYAKDKSWVLPAHDRNLDNFYGRQITVDLFASEIACDLANIHYMLGSRLPAETRQLIHQQVQRRIFDPYRQMVVEGKPRMWWLTGTNNWNAVCLANVTGTALALLEQPAEQAFYVAAAEKYITSYLKGFTADGYCSEGIGYWNYGFGAFVRLAHQLHLATGGRIDLFELPKVKQIALFGRRMELTAGQYPAFADCTVGSAPRPAIMRYVSRRFGLVPTAHELSEGDSIRWLDELGVFAFLFDPPAKPVSVAEPALRDWFPDAGILICRGGQAAQGLPVAVALKGGHNGEHHNHNDVGSFVLSVDSGMPLVDPGAEVYTRRTFSRQRYVSRVLNSFGHPVPVVAGQLQRSGRSAQAKIVHVDLQNDQDTLVLDLTSAYPVKSLRRLLRTFVFRRQPVTLTVTDEVRYSEQPATFETALITFDRWKQLAAGRLRIGSGPAAVDVEIDTGGRPLAIEAATIDEDVRGGRQPTRLGIKLTEPVLSATVRLVIRPAGQH